MHASPGLPLLERWLRSACPAIHAARVAAVVAVVGTLVRGGKLALTHLGRNLASAAFAQHNITRVDRLLGNRHLRRERPGVDRAIARWLLAAAPRSILLVDWADGAEGERWLLRRAAVPLGGRAIPIYEEVHPLRRDNSPRTHRRFLRNLRAVLPETGRPILVTDAGFRGPWFREVERSGWDWIGRVRNPVKYSPTGAEWTYTSALYPGATPTPRSGGRVLLARRQSYRCGLSLVRRYRRGPGRPRKAHGRSSAVRRCRQLYKDPWLLATSRPHDARTARRVVKLYALRMKIEQAIRDTKAARWGFGLRYARSRRAERLESLLLVAALGALACWLAGLAAEAREWGRHVQANTTRTRAVLSAIVLGHQVLASARFRVRGRDLLRAATQLPTLVAECASVT